VVWLPEIRVFENVLVFFFYFTWKILNIYILYIYSFNKLA
jgi:hypothetical protein